MAPRSPELGLLDSASEGLRSSLSVSSWSYTRVSIVCCMKGSPTYVAAEQRIHAKTTTLSIVVSIEDDQNVFDSDHNRHRPDNQRKDSEKVLLCWWCVESR